MVALGRKDLAIVETDTQKSRQLCASSSSKQAGIDILPSCTVSVEWLGATAYAIERINRSQKVRVAIFTRRSDRCNGS